MLLHTHTHPFNGPFPGLPRWAGTRKVKPIWIWLKQQTVSGSGISWAICKSAPCSRQTTTPAPHHSVFYRPDALPVTQPTASKHWRQNIYYYTKSFCYLCIVSNSGLFFCPLSHCAFLILYLFTACIHMAVWCMKVRPGLKGKKMRWHFSEQRWEWSGGCVV